MKIDIIRPFAPGVKKFIICLTCLFAIAVALIVNVVVAFALVVAMSACLIKLYQINPEPIILLLMHFIISGSMLHDPITTFALITVVVSTVATFRDYEIPKERVAVFVTSIATTSFFGTITAAVFSVAIGITIILFKFRPIQPPTLSLVALGTLALTLLADKVAGSVVVIIFIAVVTALFVVNRLIKNLDQQEPDPPLSLQTKLSHPNGYLALSNITESLDLHGHTVTGAMKALHEFLREHEDEYRKNRAQYIRHVTIITGEGNYSDPHDSTNLVKPTVVNFLKINKYKYEVSSDSPGLIKVDLESHIF
uniref:Smr domain-containing protein n=1 Tax=Arion vulgaris TaxID=1028688 RepID=A0A0B7B6M2_9EUPU